jgi:hypothetical protein
MDTTTSIERRRETFFFKGKQEVYGHSGKLIARGKTLLGQKHGKWKIFDSIGDPQRARYRFGVIRSQIRTSNGRKAKLLLVIGKPIFYPSCQEAINRFKFKKISVAGCMVNRKILWRVGLHNSFVLTSVVFRHGFNWEEEYRETCRPRKN